MLEAVERVERDERPMGVFAAGEGRVDFGTVVGWSEKMVHIEFSEPDAGDDDAL